MCFRQTAHDLGAHRSSAHRFALLYDARDRMLYRCFQRLAAGDRAARIRTGGPAARANAGRTVASTECRRDTISYAGRNALRYAEPDG